MHLLIQTLLIHLNGLQCTAECDPYKENVLYPDAVEGHKVCFVAHISLIQYFQCIAI